MPFLACLATAVIVWATAYLCAWLRVRGDPNFRKEAAQTRTSLDILSKELTRYEEKTGHLPNTLTQLGAAKNLLTPTDEYGNFVDGWRKPLRYRVVGGTYDLYSLGRDGRQGGSGLDADLHAGLVDPGDEYTTLLQFVGEEDAAAMKFYCLAAGAFAFPLCLLRSRPGSRSYVQVGLEYGGSFLFAIFTALVIAILHTPWGH